MALIEHFRPTRLGDIQIHEGEPSRRLGDRELEEAWAAKSQELPMPLPPWFLNDDVTCGIVEASLRRPLLDRAHLPANCVSSVPSLTATPQLTPGLTDNLSNPESSFDANFGLQISQQASLPSKPNRPSMINGLCDNSTSVTEYNRPISPQDTRLRYSSIQKQRSSDKKTQRIAKPRKRGSRHTMLTRSRRAVTFHSL